LPSGYKHIITNLLVISLLVATYWLQAGAVPPSKHFNFFHCPEVKVELITVTLLLIFNLLVTLREKKKKL
jgi:hypothetical protein